VNEWIDIGKAVILGLVEGATEFIPVSSTGHLIVVADWLNFEGDSEKTFEVFIQLGAILAILWLYRAKFVHALAGWRRDPVSRRLIINLAVAFLPAAIIGFLAHDFIKEALFKPEVVATTLILGGLGIFAVERFKGPERVASADDIPLRIALGVGLAQILALVPGVSRSGATIMGGLALGLSRRAATEFSFFLAVPVMIAATLFDLWSSRDVLSMSDAPVFTVGFIVAFVSALVVVRAFLAFVSTSTFRPFAWYRIAFGLLLLVWIAL
jgi:undecaprenyl-diphosphatase